MHIAEVVTIAKSLPLLRLNTYKSLILSYSADYRRILGKKTFTENIYAIVKEIMDRKYSLEEQVNYVITQVFALADILGVDLLWHINQKMRYNELRPKLNEKKY